MDHTQESPTVLSLCSGYGGLERGIKLAAGGCRVLAHVEIEAFAIENLATEMEEGKMDPAPIWTDVKTLNAEIFRDRIDILTGGYPCQPFSVIGKRQGVDDPRHLWPYIRRIIRLARPRLCFFENVEGHINLGLERVIEDLEAEGFRTSWGIFNAREVGATHLRKRIFLMGDNGDRSFRSRWETLAYCRSKRLERLAGNVDHSQGPDQWNCTSRPSGEGSILLRWPAGPESIRLGRAETGEGSGITWPTTRLSDAEGGRIETVKTDNGFRSKRHKSDKWFGAKLRDALETGKPTNERYNPDWGEQFMGLPVGTTRINNWELKKQRKDRIRLLGNGVIPQQAAVAFIGLGRKLFGEENWEWTEQKQ